MLVWSLDPRFELNAISGTRVRAKNNEVFNSTTFSCSIFARLTGNFNSDECNVSSIIRSELTYNLKEGSVNG